MACTAPISQILGVLADAFAGAESMTVSGAVRLDQPIMGLSTDSRTTAPGQLFLALVGDSFDGHGFLAAAQARGAIAAIVSRQTPADLSPSQAIDLPQILVPDTLVAYQAIARWWRQQCRATVVAITGSVGKTTTKELIAAVLATQGHVLKTQANYNNEIGVPKTLLELTPDHDYAVVEMGMRGRGEIALLCQIAQPDVGLITNVGTAHIERLGSEAAIAQAKCELLAELPPTSVAVLNGDDRRLQQTAETVWSGKTVTYGLEQGDILGSVEAEQMQVEGERFPLPLPGRHNAQNFLAAMAVAQVLGVDWAPLQAGLSVTLPMGRSQRYELPDDVVLLDETYNAGLESMVAALTMLSEASGTRRIAVLGTMKELGDHSVMLHRRVGEAVKRLGVDMLLILADEAERRSLAEGADDVASEWFTSRADLVERLVVLVQPGDRVLFKASRAVGLDAVVEQLRQRWAERLG